jgi:hypothetical protein
MKLKTALLGAACAFAFAPAAFAERGADGHVNVLYWQAPSTLNPYLSSGTKDVETGSLILEGLAGFNEKGEVIARLAESVPTVEMAVLPRISPRSPGSCSRAFCGLMARPSPRQTPNSPGNIAPFPLAAAPRRAVTKASPPLKRRMI